MSEGHNTHLRRSKESLRSDAEGGDLEMHDEAHSTRIVCYTDTGHVEVAKQRCAVQNAKGAASTLMCGCTKDLL